MSECQVPTRRVVLDMSLQFDIEDDTITPEDGESFALAAQRMFAEDLSGWVRKYLSHVALVAVREVE